MEEEVEVEAQAVSEIKKISILGCINFDYFVNRMLAKSRSETKHLE